MLEMQKLDSILFFLLYSIFRTRVRGSVGCHRSLSHQSHAMRKTVEGFGRNNIILCVIHIVVLRQTHGYLEQAKVVVHRPGV